MSDLLSVRALLLPFASDHDLEERNDAPYPDADSSGIAEIG